jgi:hypothetical protein
MFSTGAMKRDEEPGTAWAHLTGGSRDLKSIAEGEEKAGQDGQGLGACPSRDRHPRPGVSWCGGGW